MKSPAIVLHNVSKTFSVSAAFRNPEASSQTVIALEGITLSIAHGELFVFLGPSGSGKSTLLRIMSGLEPSFDGTMHYGRGLSNADVSFVFQQFALLPWLTIWENIELGLLARHARKEKRSAIVRQALRTFGLLKFANAYPRTLSGGMRQRVGIARALATDPKIIFMDEPFSELDSFTAKTLREELLNIWHKQRPTIVVVTHLLEDAITLADRIAVLTPRPGRIERIIRNTLPRPRDRRSEGFFKLEDQLTALVKP